MIEESFINGLQFWKIVMPFEDHYFPLSILCVVDLPKCH
ncbi:Unknown protein sequence [Pseudomonas coronafaciens pv. oryzae]|nr:Unknown protein sequence [Pseudomonas coronafaciens pv. oryzae]